MFPDNSLASDIVRAYFNMRIRSRDMFSGSYAHPDRPRRPNSSRNITKRLHAESKSHRKQAAASNRINRRNCKGWKH